MKEHGLLLSGEMVRAYMAGRKTMTRRVMTPNNTRINGSPRGQVPYGRKWDDFDFDAAYINDNVWSSGPFLMVPLPCEGTVHRFYPIYEVDDGIWWREKFGECRFPGTDTSFGHIKTIYAADGETTYSIDKWRPSIHMPKSVCRNRSIITSRRPERTQDISEEDVIREGIPFNGVNWGWGDGFSESSMAFHHLWSIINAKRGYGWDVNPWVWVIEFLRCETTTEETGQ